MEQQEIRLEALKLAMQQFTHGSYQPDNGGGVLILADVFVDYINKITDQNKAYK